jgi:outer membrane murein-binding lipoprotein Lpp
MRYAAMLIGCAILAGCNSEPDVDMKNASVGDLAREVRESSSGESFVRPGYC